MSNTVIQLKNSGGSGNTPGTLQPGELAINYADGKLYYGNAVNTAILFDAITEPAGLNQEIQFNSSGAFGASANLKFDSSTKTLTTKNVAITFDGSITFPDNTVQNTAWTGTGLTGPQGPQGAQGPAGPTGPQGATGTNIDSIARDVSNLAFGQANLAYNQANVGGGNSFAIIASSGFPDIVANTNNTRLTFFGQTGIAIGTDSQNSIISIATNLIGASNVIIDYGSVTDNVGVITFDYGYLI